MFFKILSKVMGLLKTITYKMLYFSRISFKGIPTVSKNINYSIKKHSKLSLGKGFKARNNVSFRIYDSGKVMIGNNVFLNDNVSVNCRERITIGSNTIIGPNTLFFDHDHDYRNKIDQFTKKEIKVGANVWIGAGCIILKGVSIGDNSIIAAGTTVLEDVECNSIIYQKKETRRRQK